MKFHPTTSQETRRSTVVAWGTLESYCRLWALGERRLYLWVLVALVLSLGSCKSDSSGGNGAGGNVDGSGASANGGEGSGAGASVLACEPVGGFRCNPSAPERLEACDPTTVSGWTHVDTCGSAELCDPELGRCRRCEPGSYRCDAWQLQACAADGSDWTLLSECDSAEFCDSRNVQCLACLPGSGYCSGATLFSCNASQDGFAERDCGESDNCNSTSMSCRPCIPGEYQCSLEQLQVCNESQKWEVADTCETPQLCALTHDKLLADPAAEPVCEPPACEVGAYQCAEGDGRNLLGCPPSRAEWQVIDVCDTPELCNADAGSCDDATCVPGEPQCDGIALQRCSSAGTEWETIKTCASANQCNVSAGDCIECQPGEVQCNGPLLQDCSEDQEWVTRTTCASAQLCTINTVTPEDSYCAPPQCTQPGDQYRCDQRQLQVCNADLGFETVESCESAALCNAMDGRCNPPGCTSAGQHRCQNNALEVCPDDLTGWSAVQQCAPGSVCDLDILGCSENCPENRFRCNGALPEECLEFDDGSIEWQVVGIPCATPALCWASSDEAGCSAPVCGGSLNDYRCNPDNPSLVEQCNSGRSGWDLALTCSDGSTCDPGPSSDGPAQCDICAPNDFSCGNGVLSQCGPNGQTIRVLENCGQQSRCVDPSDGSQGYCLRCDAAQTQCNGDNLDTCAPDRRGWVPDEDCDPESGCHDNPGSSDYCNVCRIPQETRCEGSSTLRTCTPEQDAWSGTTACMFGCQDSNLNDYCRSCVPNSAECSASSSDERRACSSAGRWQDFVVCPGGSDCFDVPNDGDYCGSCDPGSSVCVNQTQIQRCQNNGLPGDILDCGGTTPVCLGATNSCVECAPGSNECTGSGRRTCGSDGFWDSANCPSGEVCLNGDCVACSPGSERCTGGTTGGRQVCSATGAWETRNCTTSDAPFCFEGTCSECTNTSASRCSGSNMPGREVCTEGQWTSADCSSAQVCVAGMCQQCDPAAGAQCTTDSAGRRVCEDGNWVQADCSGATPVCQGGACRCQTDATRCSSSSGGRQRCVSGMWVDDECDSGVCVDGSCAECAEADDCPNAAFPVCMGGECVCAVGDERCLNSAHQVCQQTADGNAWTSAVCGGDTPICSNGDCICADDTQRCQSGILQTCSSGTWANEPGTECTACTANADCENPTPLCDEGICEPCSSSPNNCIAAVCAAGSCVECSTADTTYCANGEVCSADQECVPCSSQNTCRGGLVCVGGMCQMGECSDGGQRCSSGIRQVCSAGVWEDDPCGNPEPVCSAGGVCAPCTEHGQCGIGICVGGSCQAAQCVGSEARCSGTSYQLCDEGVWTTEQSCMGATPACDEDAGCVECGTDADCSGATPVCSGGACIACSDDGDCADLGGNCASDGSCISAECASDADCSEAALPVCAGGSCVACSADNASACPESSPLCSQNNCVQCTTADSSACTGATSVCTDNECVECTNGAERCTDAGHELCTGNAWSSAPCPTNQVCDAASGTCIESTAPGAGGAQ